MYKYKYFIQLFLFCTSITLIFSQNMQDLQRMKAEFENSQRNQAGGIIPLNENIDQEAGLPRRADILNNRNQVLIEDSLKSESKYFGYDFFTKRDSVSFWENLPTPPNYLLGPGDELVIALWGETQLRQKYTISREGTIYDQKVGVLSLVGKTLEEANKYLLSQFSRFYSTLKGNSPTTYMDLSLGKLRSINVNFVGEVNFPGVYPVHPFSNVITGLIQSGGIDTTGSLRNIKIMRNGQTYSTIDFYDYFLNGMIPQNIQLRDQDIILVPVRGSTVRIDSAVVRPGIYESKPNETILQMINYAGGLRSHASTKIGLRRIIPLPNRVDSETDSKNFYIEYKNANITKAEDGDIITVLSILSSTSQVEIIGRVKKPGFYHYYPGMTVKELINLSGGFNDTTFFKSVHQSQAELIRRDEKSRYEKVIILDLKKLLNDENSTDLSLQNLDRIIVHSNFNFFERKNIQISGEIKIPGFYPLLSNDETLESIIDRAGGFSSKALKNGISIYRDKTFFEEPPEDKILNELLPESSINLEQNKKYQEEENRLKLAWTGENVILMPGDSIIVKEKVGAVFVTGEVYRPGLVEFQKGKSIRYYLNSAGGINNYGNRNNVVVVLPNGITKPWRRLRAPKIADGSTIVVYRKADVTPINATEFASNMASLISSFVTVILLSKQI